MTRRGPSDKELCRRALLDGPKTTVELLQICPRFSARLDELKLDGFLWTKSAYGTLVKGGTNWLYTHTSDAEASAGQGAAVPSSPAVPHLVMAGARLGIGAVVPFHCCTLDGYVWKDPGYPTHCPSCLEGVHWIEDFVHLHQAQDRAKTLKPGAIRREREAIHARLNGHDLAAAA